MLILKIGIILVLTNLLSQGKKSRILGFSFLVIAIVMAFQSNVEGDFVRYEEDYNSQLDQRTAEDEPFWYFLMSACSTVMPFRLFYVLLVAFQVFVSYVFTKQYVSKKYSWVAPLIFFFTFNIMLMQMKAIRQGLAVELCLLSFYLMDKAKLWKASMPAILSFLVHNSSIIVLPLLVFYYLILRKPLVPMARKKRGEWFWPTVMAAMTIVVYVVKAKIINNYILAFAALFSQDDFRLIGYFGEAENEFSFSIVILIYNVFLVFLSTWYYRTAPNTERIMCIATIAASYIEILFFGMGSLFRMAMYFNVFTITLIPNILYKIENRFGKGIAFILVILFIGYAIKTSYPWLISSEADRFGNYKLRLF